MKQIVLPLLLLTSSLLTMTAWIKLPDTPRVYTNSLLVNGYPLDYTTFSLYNRGVLSLADGAPGSSAYKPLLFRVVLRRDGTLTKQWPASETEGVSSLQLEQIWPFAKLGDELVVEPVNSPDQPQPGSSGKRVIKLRTIIWFNWLKSDKC